MKVTCSSERGARRARRARASHCRYRGARPACALAACWAPSPSVLQERKGGSVAPKSKGLPALAPGRRPPGEPRPAAAPQGLAAGVEESVAGQLTQRLRFPGIQGQGRAPLVTHPQDPGNPELLRVLLEALQDGRELGVRVVAVPCSMWVGASALAVKAAATPGREPQGSREEPCHRSKRDGGPFDSRGATSMGGGHLLSLKIYPTLTRSTVQPL